MERNRENFETREHRLQRIKREHAAEKYNLDPERISEGILNRAGKHQRMYCEKYPEPNVEIKEGPDGTRHVILRSQLTRVVKDPETEPENPKAIPLKDPVTGITHHYVPITSGGLPTSEVCF